MCIIMYMNIYITPQNEEQLRKEVSMSGLINRLLAEYFEHNALKDTLQTKPPITTTVTSGMKIISSEPDEPTVDVPACCKKKQPCRHWSYDGLSEQWTNSITGEVKTIE